MRRVGGTEAERVCARRCPCDADATATVPSRTRACAARRAGAGPAVPVAEAAADPRADPFRAELPRDGPEVGEVPVAEPPGTVEMPGVAASPRGAADGDPGCPPGNLLPTGGVLTSEGGRDAVPSDGVVMPGVLTCGVVIGPALTVGVVIGGIVTVGVVSEGTVTGGTDKDGLGAAALAGVAGTPNSAQARSSFGIERLVEEIAARVHAQPIPHLSTNDGVDIPHRLSTGLVTHPFTRI